MGPRRLDRPFPASESRVALRLFAYGTLEILELMRAVAGRCFASLDRFEGDLYERRSVTVHRP